MFPDFNIYSTPLLILVVQGLMLVALLFSKARSKNDLSSLILGILLLITCYHRTTYTIGFMGWYDTYQNTKINYFLISLELTVGPLIYLYIRSVGQTGFRLRSKQLLHFLLALLWVIYSIGILIYDSMQVGYSDTQNGPLKQWTIEYFDVIFYLVLFIQLLLYLIYSFQLYYKIRSRLDHQFSNTYNFEMRWLRNFLFLFTILFIYDSLQLLADEFFIDLHWTQGWWYQFFSLLVVIYVGLKGYFTPIENLPLLAPEMLNTTPRVRKSEKSNDKSNLQKELASVSGIVNERQLYLDPNLTLTKLAKEVNIAPSQLSFVINKASGQNFNEYINTYRVSDVKTKLQSEDYHHLSILALALDAGFNSKATFNRVFKKLDGHPPSFYRNSQ